MTRTIRAAVVCATAVIMTVTGLMGTASAGSTTIIGEQFNGTAPELSRRWKDVHADWRRVNGAARIVRSSVSPVTNLGYSVRTMRSSYAKRGMAVWTKLRLSPTHANVGLVGPYKSVGNHLFCKVENTPAHRKGMLAIGHRIRNRPPDLVKAKDNLGLTAARRYTLKLTRNKGTVICSLVRGSTVYASLRHVLTAAERAAFGGGRKVGIRMRLVARGTRRDEDDGRSRFESFVVRTLG